MVMIKSVGPRIDLLRIHLREMDRCQDVMSAAHRFYIAFKNESEGEFAVDSPIFFVRNNRRRLVDLL